MPPKGLPIEARTRGQLDGGDHTFAEPRVRDAENRAGHHRRIGQEYALDLDRVDVGAAPQDEFLAPSTQDEFSGSLEFAEIPGVLLWRDTDAEGRLVIAPAPKQLELRVLVAPLLGDIRPLPACAVPDTEA